MAWLSLAYKYRKPITLSNSGSSLSDYQTLITLDTASLISAGRMKSDGSDIRFTDDDGTTLLGYWIESGINTSSTKIWVKVPSIPNGSKTIYLYYGNPSASAVSDEENVFDYVDRGNKTSTWTIVGSASQSTSEGNSLPSYYAVSTNGSYMYKNIGLVPQRILTFNVKSNQLGNFYFLTNSSGAGQYYRLDVRQNQSYSGFATTSSWTSWNAPSTGFYGTGNTWYKLTIVITSSTSATFYYSQTTDASPSGFGTLLNTYTITNNGGYIGLVGDAGGSSYTTWWDNIIVRKYASTEPTVSVGTETLLPNFFPFL